MYIIITLGLLAAYASAYWGLRCLFRAAVAQSDDMTDEEARAYLLASSGAVRIPGGDLTPRIDNF